MRVALLQLCSKELPSDNTARALRLARSAAAADAEWLLFPENTLYVGDSPAKIADTVNGSLLEPFRECAAELGVWITVGSFPERIGGSPKIHNTQVLIDPMGAIHATYRKIHLFDVTLPSGQTHAESERVLAGDEVVVTEMRTSSGVWRVGLTTCYDLRFPELYRRLVDDGAQIITAPSAFTFETGAAHWHPLIQTRAIENQVYVLAPNQCGKHGGARHSFGNSCVVDPWGTQLARAMEGESIAYADLSRQYLTQVRSNLPSLAHRRIRLSGRL
jgi:predicted amidohydrolase